MWVSSLAFHCCLLTFLVQYLGISGAAKCNQRTQMRCANGKACIHKSWVCDGEKDCSDGSDESNCKFAKCTSKEFKCRNKKCIPISRRCDRVDHCGDYSDEIGCRTVPSLNCNSVGVFQCSGSNLCIDEIKVCNGRRDCPNGDDEPDACGVNECLENSSGCSQICTDMKIGFKCSCNQGFKLNGDGRTCDDINECKVYGSCSQICENTRGSYNCKCQHGYHLQGDGKSCKVNGRRPSLIVANRVNIIQIEMDGTGIKRLVPAEKIGGVLTVDVNPHDGYMYWADYIKGVISRTKINANGTNKVETVVNGKLTKAEGIAVDWIGNKIYWTNTERKCIEVSNLDGTYRKQLITSGINKPRGIAVLPSKRFIFWTDWGKSPKIERASMDGSNRQTIIHPENLQWPNSVTVDQITERVYWVDRRAGYIASSTLDGSDMRKIITSNVGSSFGLAVFEDLVFWSQTNGKVFKANKMSGENVEDVKGAFFSPYMVQVYHPAVKPKGSNPCGSNNGGCMHLCLLSTLEDGYSCACADNYKLVADGKTCK